MEFCIDVALDCLSGFSFTPQQLRKCGVLLVSLSQQRWRQSRVCRLAACQLDLWASYAVTLAVVLTFVRPQEQFINKLDVGPFVSSLLSMK